jgi:drug/metabolite transporter (DMT)-like permease
MAAPWLWIVFTLVAAASQTVRNLLQKSLTGTLGTIGATHVRFLYGLPFGVAFLAIVIGVTGIAPPLPGPVTLAWAAMGALTQIAATALMLAAMQLKSVVVVTAYVKTEPVLVAVFGLALLGDPVTMTLLGAILLATAGVLLMTWPKAGVGEIFAMRPALLGLSSAGLFGLSAVGFRGAITTLGSGSYVIDASTVLVLSLTIQSVVLTGWLAFRDRKTLVSIFREWRRSLPAGFTGAFASQAWFLAFAVESAAKVRTLALVEILFAQLLAGRFLKERAGWREWLGIGAVALGVVLLLNG